MRRPVRRDDVHDIVPGFANFYIAELDGLHTAVQQRPAARLHDVLAHHRKIFVAGELALDGSVITARAFGGAEVLRVVRELVEYVLILVRGAYGEVAAVFPRAREPISGIARGDNARGLARMLVLERDVVYADVVEVQPRAAHSIPGSVRAVEATRERALKLIRIVVHHKIVFLCRDLLVNTRVHRRERESVPRFPRGDLHFGEHTARLRVIAPPARGRETAVLGRRVDARDASVISHKEDVLFAVRAEDAHLVAGEVDLVQRHRDGEVRADIRHLVGVDLAVIQRPRHQRIFRLVVLECRRGIGRVDVHLHHPHHGRGGDIPRVVHVVELESVVPAPGAAVTVTVDGGYVAQPPCRNVEFQPPAHRAEVAVCRISYGLPAGGAASVHHDGGAVRLRKRVIPLHGIEPHLRVRARTRIGETRREDGLRVPQPLAVVFVRHILVRGDAHSPAVHVVPAALYAVHIHGDLQVTVAGVIHPHLEVAHIVIEIQRQHTLRAPRVTHCPMVIPVARAFRGRISERPVRERTVVYRRCLLCYAAHRDTGKPCVIRRLRHRRIAAVRIDLVDVQLHLLGKASAHAADFRHIEAVLAHRHAVQIYGGVCGVAIPNARLRHGIDVARHRAAHAKKVALVVLGEIARVRPRRRGLRHHLRRIAVGTQWICQSNSKSDSRVVGKDICCTTRSRVPFTRSIYSNSQIGHIPIEMGITPIQIHKVS